MAESLCLQGCSLAVPVVHRSPSARRGVSRPGTLPSVEMRCIGSREFFLVLGQQLDSFNRRRVLDGLRQVLDVVALRLEHLVQQVLIASKETVDVVGLFPT